MHQDREDLTMSEAREGPSHVAEGSITEKYLKMEKELIHTENDVDRLSKSNEELIERLAFQPQHGNLDNAIGSRGRKRSCSLTPANS